MKELTIIGAVIGVVIDIPLIIGILKGKIKQNFLTYFLWGLLDFIVFMTIVFQHGQNFWLPLFYAMGSTTIAIFLVFKGQSEWSLVETIVVVLILICLFIWWQIGSRAANIVGVIALCIASIPQIISTFKDPLTTPTGIYLVYALAALLSFIGGEHWSVEDKLFPGGSLFLSILLAILSMRKGKINI